MSRNAVVVGGGPAGLMAAEVIAQAGHSVVVLDAMASVGRKFLLAGRGGLNLTHVEARPEFDSRYREAAPRVAEWLDAFGPDALRDWVHGLDVSTFVGSSGRVFPAEMKAAPLLRRWLHRLRAQGIVFRARHRWTGWTDDGALRISSPDGEGRLAADALVLATGGASWSRLGSNGAWQQCLGERGVALAPLAPANCGFDVDWSAWISERFAGHPLKSIAMCTQADPALRQWRIGEAIVSSDGLEGSLIYALSADLREQIACAGEAIVWIDLLPARSLAQVDSLLARPTAGKSMANVLRTRLRLDGVKAGLLRELVPASAWREPAQLARWIKALPVRLLRTRPIDEAISSAGGVRFAALDAQLMLHRLPGVFCAGEMIDWEAPTGGYLLTACLASGRVAGAGAAAWLEAR